MSKYLTIVEVSQKQAYIFKSKKLKNNIIASKIIDYVTSSEFFSKVCNHYDEEQNLVYSGGGHAVLVFDDEESVIEFNKLITSYTLNTFDGLELFVKCMKMDENKTPMENVMTLKSMLEEKKSLRIASFSQGSFGVEEYDPRSRDKAPCDSSIMKDLDEVSGIDAAIEKEINTFKLVNEIELLSKDWNKNFVSIVHIDGNQMGKKVAESDSEIKSKFSDSDSLEKCLDTYKRTKKEFSAQIDKMFKEAYINMVKSISERIADKEAIFPVRRIITAGDDICFVAAGEWGIEAAKIFISELWRISNGKYSACAGVAIVHSKYPFHKAYNLAEELCSSAKKFIAKLGSSEQPANLCAIDWHVEFGELIGGLSEVRQMYLDKETNQSIITRPYVVVGDKHVDVPEEHKFSSFVDSQYDLFKIGNSDGDSMARSKIKGLRTALKKGPSVTKDYIIRNRLSLLEDDKSLFDAIEIGDLYIGTGGMSK